MDVSIVIVSWNTKEVLRDCLRSIYEQAGKLTYEVIVVDNDSLDDTAGMVAREFPTVQLIHNKVNRGFAAANNQGINVANGRYILVLNPDTVILDGAIAKTVSFADKHPDAGVVGCRVLNSDGSLQRSCYQYHSVFNILISTFGLHRFFPKSRFFGRQDMTWWDFEAVREIDVVAGCFMLVRREAIEQVGLMDERYFMYTEETDWCWRMKSQGWKMLYFPDVEIIHLGGVSANQCSLEMQLEAIRSRLLFVRKTQGAIAQWIANLLLFTGTLLRFCWWTCSIPFCSTANTKAIKRKRERAFRALKLHFHLATGYTIKRAARLAISLAYFPVLSIRQRLSRIIGHCRPNVLPVLYYHNVTREQKKNFAHQMDVLLRYAKPVFADIENSTNQYRQLIAITFDDGFHSVVINALPELRQRNIPVTIFIPSGCLAQSPNWIERNGNLNRNETVVSVQQLKQLCVENVLIGSHSVSHCHMTDLSEKEIWLELTESKRELESILGQTIDLFSFPFGEYTSNIIDLAKRAGYRHVFTIDPCLALPSRDQFVRGRIRVSPDDWPIEFWLKIRGAYCWLAIAQKIKRQMLRLLTKTGRDARKQQMGHFSK